MRFVLPFLAFALLAPASASADAGALCASISQGDRQECPPLPRVTYGPDLRVEVVTVQRNLTFPVPAGDDELRSYCRHGKCVCSEAVQRLDFKGPVPGFARANEAEMRAASALKCTAQNSNVERDVLHFAVTKAAVSTAVFELAYCHGCGGSCHGRAVLAAYDARSGVPILLKDAIDPRQLSALKARLVGQFVMKNFTGDDRAFGLEQVGRDIASLTLESGVYVEGAKVFVNIDTFALSCAAGPFHPVEVPAPFLTPGFRARLK